MESGLCAAGGWGWGSELTDGVMGGLLYFLEGAASALRVPLLPLGEADNGASPDLEAPKSGSICRATRFVFPEIDTHAETQTSRHVILKTTPIRL